MAMESNAIVLQTLKTELYDPTVSILSTDTKN